MVNPEKEIVQKILQVKLPNSANHKLKILAVTAGMTLRDYCTKVLIDHANK